MSYKIEPDSLINGLDRITNLQEKVTALTAELEAAKTKHQAKIDITRKAQKVIQQGLSASISDLQSWLYLPKLLDKYQFEIALALQQGTFSTWQNREFKQLVEENQQAIVKWVEQAYEFFDCPQPAALSISFLERPQVFLPEQPQQSTTSRKSDDVTRVALTSGIGWLSGDQLVRRWLVVLPIY